MSVVKIPRNIRGSVKVQWHPDMLARFYIPFDYYWGMTQHTAALNDFDTLTTFAWEALFELNKASNYNYAFIYK